MKHLVCHWLSPIDKLEWFKWVWNCIIMEASLTFCKFQGIYCRYKVIKGKSCVSLQKQNHILRTNMTGSEWYFLKQGLVVFFARYNFPTYRYSVYMSLKNNFFTQKLQTIHLRLHVSNLSGGDEAIADVTGKIEWFNHSNFPCVMPRWCNVIFPFKL